MTTETNGNTHWEQAKSVADKVGLKERDFDTYLQLHKKRHLEYRSFASELELLRAEKVGDLKELKILANRVREFLEIESIFEAAERARELEASNERISKIALNRQKYIDEMTEENARLREALEFYADKKHYEASYVNRLSSLQVTERGETARQALKGESN